MSSLRWIWFFSTFLFIGPHDAQDMRKTVLIEHFTQASCPPCNPTNVYLNNLLKSYGEDEVVIMRYQASFPGYDPMYRHNPGEVLTREQYYSVRSVPSSVINGEGPKFTRSFVTASRLSKEVKEHAGCALRLEARYSQRYDSVFVYAVVRALRPFYGKEKLRIALIERHIRYQKPPGTNGEKDFYNVFRRFITGAAGAALSKLAVGDTQVLHFSVPLSAIYRRHQLAIVAFVQNDEDKTVYQTQYLELALHASHDLVLSGLYPNAHPSVDVSCFSSLGPYVEIVNISSRRAGTFDVLYRINARESRYTVQGGIAPFDTVWIPLPAIDFQLNPSNTLYATIENFEDGDDAFEANNTLSRTFSLAPYVEPGSAHISIMRMRKPEAIHLTIRENDSFLLVQKGLPSHQRNYELSVALREGNCYEIQLINSASGASNGVLNITHSSGTTLKRLRRLRKDTITLLFRTFKSTHTNYVFADPSRSLSLECVETNPGYWVVSIRCRDSRPITIQMRDQMGRLLYSTSTHLRSGEAQLTIPRPVCAQGMLYLVAYSSDAHATLTLMHW